MRSTCTYILFLLMFFSQTVFAVIEKEGSEDDLRLQNARSVAGSVKTLTELENYINKYYDQPEVIVYIEALLSESFQADSLTFSFKALSELMIYCHNHGMTDRYNYWVDHIDSLVEEKKINPDISYDAHLNKANMMLESGQYEQVIADAISLYDKAHKNDHVYGMICSSDILGLIYLYSRRDSAALVAFRDVLSGLEKLGEYPGYQLRVLSYLIDLNLRLGNIDDAKEYLTKYEQVLSWRDEENKKKNIVYEINWYEWLMSSFQVNLYLHQDKLEEAEKELAIASSFYKEGMFPHEDYSVYYFLYTKAFYYKKLKKYDEALALIDFILADNPEFEVMKLKVNILSETGRFEEALDVYNQIYQITEKDNNESLIRQINNLRLAYDINEQNVREKELQLNKIQVEEKQRLSACVILISLVLLILFIVLFLYYRRIQKLKDALIVERNSLIISRENLNQEKKNAEIANQLKNAFIANISHEIRTPLNAIVGFSCLLSDPVTEEEEKVGFVNLISKNTNLLLNLVNDVLDLSRLEAGTVKLAIEPCELVGCCREALSNIRYYLSSDIKLTFDTSVGSFTIMTASQQLSQLISRLLDNAVKFTKEGEINLSLFVDEEARIVRFTVTDTGPGIPLDKQEKIFERFEKLDEFSQGSGLGLTICRIIAEHLGGEVNIDPEYTNGARFVFTHPYIN